jgi:two-component system chemotaxis response regulator CheY
MPHCILANESRILRHVMRRIVEQRGFEAVEARDGPEVLDLCRQALPDLLCIDEDLPEIDSINLIKMLRAEASHPLPPILFTYIARDDVLLSRAQAAGVQHFLQTPFTAAQMDHVLAKLL